MVDGFYLLVFKRGTIGRGISSYDNINGYPIKKIRKLSLIRALSTIESLDAHF